MFPQIIISPAAVSVLRGALDEASDGDVVHLSVSPGFDHALEVGPANPGDAVQDVSGIPVCVEAEGLARADGISIDFVETDAGGGFRIENPNAPPKLTELEARDLKGRLEAKEIEVLVDVRTPWEREIAHLPGSVLLDEGSYAQLAELPKDTPIAFYCHHGMRSRAAASRFIEEGFSKIYNLAGGIDAWSQSVDSNIPRY